MKLAGLHLHLYQQGDRSPTPEQLEAITLKYYVDCLNYVKSWQALGAELGLLNKSALTFHSR
jgi:hypothetical protein